jgi:hypothetical protein
MKLQNKNRKNNIQVNINKTIIKRDEETADLEHDDAHRNIK